MKLKLLLFLAILLSHLAGAEEIAVGSGDRIQDAIDKAISGDVINVQSGTYYENLKVNKMLTLLGMDTGGGKPIIDASGIGSAVTLSEDGIRFKGFTVTNSSRPAELRGFYKIVPEGIDPQLAFAGILIDGSENCTIENNTAILNDVGILLWKADGNRIMKNIARENTYAGIALSEHCRNNTISGNSAVKSIPGDGIRVSGSNNTFVDNNARENAYYGIMLWESPSNILHSNVAHDNGHSGLWLMNSSGNIVKENNFSHNNIVRKNRADYNEWGGIGLYLGSEENAVKDNEVGYNNWAGIILTGCDGNVVAGNNISRNVLGGIKLQKSQDNLLFQNNLVENAMDEAAVRGTSPLIKSILESAPDKRTSNAYDDAINQWDNGTFGNYYSDFDCKDLDNDCICDSKHSISGGDSVDRHPLARPNSYPHMGILLEAKNLSNR